MTVTFDRRGICSEGLRAGPAICMSLMERFGITGIIDDACIWDGQRVLSPGNAVKAVAGTMFTENPKQAMHNVSLFYSNAPADRLFGPEADLRSLNDTAIGRNLETVFAADTEMLMYTVCARVKGALGLEPRVFNIDPTNVTVDRSAGEEYTDLAPGAPVPMLGHPKDGSTGRVQYNISSAVDEFGLAAYMRTCDGNKDDTAMISEAVRFIERMLGDKRMIAVADSKMTHWSLVDHMFEHGTHFVSRPQEKFAGGIKAKAIEAAKKAGDESFVYIGRIGSRRDSPEFEAFETDLGYGGRVLRMVVYRSTDYAKRIRHMRRLDGKALKDLKASLESASFGSEEEARSKYSEAIRPYSEKCFDTSSVFRSRRSSGGGTEWKVTFRAVFNEQRALRFLKDDMKVLVTSLPRSDVGSDDPTEGAATRDVMALYFGQWKIENLFGTMKSGMGADDVFFQNPDREAAMVFIMGVAALIRAVVKRTLRSEYGRGFGIPGKITAERMFLLVQNTVVKYDRGEDRLYLDGSSDDIDTALSFIDALGIDPAKLLG